MAVAYESVSTTAFGSVTSGNSFTITKPTGLAAGDLMVAHLSAVIATGANGDFTTPSGWTSLVNQNQNADSNSEARLAVFYKIADSSDASATDFSFTLNTNNAYCGGALYRISGASTVTGAINVATGTTTPSFSNTITPGFSDSLLLFCTTCADAGQTSGTVSTYAIATDNPTWTERYDFSFNAGVGQPRGVMAGATGPRSQMTATGNSSCTFSAHQQNSVGAIVVIAPRVDVSPAPSVLTVTASIQSPTVTGTASVTPTVATITASIPAPTVSTPTPDWDTVDKTVSASWTNTAKS